MQKYTQHIARVLIFFTISLTLGSENLKKDLFFNMVS